MKSKCKKCTICKKSKLRNLFNKNSKTKDGLQWHCRECSHNESRRHYEENKPIYYSRTMQRRQANLIRNKLIVYNHLIDHPCVDCGVTDPVVLEFDHVRGEKVKGITWLVCTGSSSRVLLEEMEKCDVRCANCHRKKTVIERGWNKDVSKYLELYKTDSIFKELMDKI